MKKLIALALAVLMIFTCLIGCKDKAASGDLANAVSYLENMYQTGKKDEPMKIETDKDVLSVVTVDGVSYNVEWSVTITEGASDAVAIIESETTNCVKIDVPELPEADILFTATATVKDDKGNSAAATFSFKVFGLNIDNGDDTTDSSTDDTSSEDGTSSEDDTTGEDGNTSNNTPSNNTPSNNTPSNNTPSNDNTSTQLSVVTDQAKILKDAFALGKNKTTPYIAVLTGKVISITKEYNEQYGSLTAIITVGGKNITCYNMKVGSVSGGSKLKAGDTITVKGVIKNFYYDEADSSGTVEFTWDEASQTEVVLTKLVVGKEETKTLSIVDNPTVGTAYKFGFVQTKKNATYYAVGGMNGYYMSTSTSSAVAIDVYLEKAGDGYYLYAMIDGKKKYMDMEQTADGKHINAVYVDNPGVVFKYDTTMKTLVAERTKNGETSLYAFGTYGDYVTIGSTDTAKEGYVCHFYK